MPCQCFNRTYNHVSALRLRPCLARYFLSDSQAPNCVAAPRSSIMLHTVPRPDERLTREVDQQFRREQNATKIKQAAQLHTVLCLNTRATREMTQQWAQMRVQRLGKAGCAQNRVQLKAKAGCAQNALEKRPALRCVPKKSVSVTGPASSFPLMSHTLMTCACTNPNP